MYNWVRNIVVEKYKFYIGVFGFVVFIDQLIIEKDMFRMGVLLIIKGFFFFFNRMKFIV